ncbi:MAG: secondary thiamine-phosphate synthase enzyme YjbQ [Verrucomicrobiae bacterium]|nr:secondary thiamine-phosphate synthase enzyme YjbQ [Verrucomicrobiae bacterium]
MKELTIRSTRHEQLINVTHEVQRVVDESGVRDGICVVYVPHTTAGVTINENADPDVVADILYALDRAVPWTSPQYRHGEGNSAAHVKASLVGASVHLLVVNGRIQLGTWQAIYFCEFDGPRSRKLWVMAR